VTREKIEFKCGICHTWGHSTGQHLDRDERHEQMQDIVDRYKGKRAETGSARFLASHGFPKASVLR